ncbi:MAG TPA: ABC transporter permease [Kofleriaceae bacterium]|nr:ABC transporter permease [Kofleriaceae bacterium]
MIASMFTLAFLASIIRISVPYVLAALGGSVTERSGMVDLALEGKLLFGAFAAAAVGHATNSALAGIVAAMAVGMLVASLQALCALVFEADQAIVGIAINLLALGGTRFLLQLLFHEGSNSPPAPSYGTDVVENPIVWLAVLAALLVPFAVWRTRWGLRLRASGDRPESLLAVGVRPNEARLWAALVGGALTGAGGAQLSLAVGGFSADMTSGRGYIALAMVILGGWRPAYAVLACVGIAAAEALNILLQTQSVAIPRELAPLLPYVLTLVVLAVWGSKGRKAPASLGKL